MGQFLHGSATTTHAVRAAIQRSKATIHFAYPDGDYNERVVSALNHRGASSACTVDAAPTTAMTSPLKILRYCLGDSDFSGVELFKLTRIYKAIKKD